MGENEASDNNMLQVQHSTAGQDGVIDVVPWGIPLTCNPWHGITEVYRNSHAHSIPSDPCLLNHLPPLNACTEQRDMSKVPNAYLGQYARLIIYSQVGTDNCQRLTQHRIGRKCCPLKKRVMCISNAGRGQGSEAQAKETSSLC